MKAMIWGASVISGLVIGTGIAWWMDQLEHPWITIGKPQVVYTPHDQEITITTAYMVDHECLSVSTWHYLIILWDGEVRAFSAPDLRSYDPGMHHITDQFLWLDERPPHGAVVRVVCTCLTETPELRISLGGPMRFMDFRGLPAKPEDFVATRRPRTLNPG